MYVEILRGTAGHRAVLVDASNCSRLHVAAADASTADVHAALEAAGLGSMVAGSDDDTCLTLSTLREMAFAQANDSSYPDQWEAMISYARRMDWVTADGAGILAHIIRT